MDADFHLLGFAAEPDEHLRDPVEQRQADAHLHQLLVGELLAQRRLQVGIGRAGGGEERIGELQRELPPVRQR